MNITQARQAHRLQTAGGWLALTVLHSPLRFLLESAVAEVAYVGSRTGRIIRLPVMYARAGNQVAILVGAGHRKTWWRNFRRPNPMQLCIGGRLWYGTATVASPGTPQFHAALNLYRQRFPHVHYRPGDQLVATTLLTYPDEAGDGGRNAGGPRAPALGDVDVPHRPAQRPAAALPPDRPWSTATFPG